MNTSVAMATFNGEPYLEQQLQSIAHQTETPDELVVSDDGSSDKTAHIVEQFAKNVSFSVHLTRNKRNVGYAQNFLNAIQMCRGELVFISDQDDVWLPDKIKKVSEYHKSADSPLLTINDQLIVDQDLTPTGITTLQRLTARRQQSQFVHGCCTAFSRSFIPFLSPLPEGLAHDDWLHTITECIQVRRIIRTPLQLYRRHIDTTTASEANALTGFQQKRQITGSKAQRIASLRNRESLIRTAIDRFAGANNEWDIGDIHRRTKHQLESLDSRASVLHASWPANNILALKMLFSGQYRHFSGLMSFLRDASGR